MKIKYYILFLSLLLISTQQSVAQITLAYDPVSCGIPTTNVTVAYSCATDTPSNAGIASDDVYSPYIPIGFSFTFYGNTYTQLTIGANGNISFRDSLAGTYNPWSIVGSLAGSTIRNSICGPWCDMDFPSNGGSCTFRSSGTAPNRKFTVTYCRVSTYNIPFCAGEWITSQIILYETTNYVEVHITHKTVCTSWNNGRAICGVIDATGSSYTIAPARDWLPNWTATNESWRFTPVGSTSYSVAPIDYTSPSCGTAVYWYDNVTGAYLGKGSRINISTVVTRQIKAAVFSNCKDSSFYYITVPTPSTIYPLPKEILGPDSMCVGATFLYTDSSTGGTWSISSALSATIASSGINVTGVAAGLGLIEYKFPTGCSVGKIITVNPTPAAISPSLLKVCRGSTIICSNDSTGGKWSCSDTAIGKINISSGEFTGLTTGTAIITYKLPKGCFVVSTITVNPMPSHIVPESIVICQGNTKTLYDTIAGGSWSSFDTSIVTINPSSGILSAISPGITGIRYELPTGCYRTASVTVNVSPGSISPSPASVCIGSMLVVSDADYGGSWSSSNPTRALVGVGSGIVTPVSPGTTTISYTFTNGCFKTLPLTVNPIPATILPSVLATCVGSSLSLINVSAGGVWSIDSAHIATVGAATGILTGISPGIATVTYTLATGCYRTATVTINSASAAITPSHATACQGNSIFLSCSSAGGTWSSNNTAVATVAMGSGIVTAVSPGTAIISYILPGFCYRTDTITIRPLPSAITPANVVICQGGIDTFAASPAGGVWSSNNTAIAVIDTTGIVTATGPGTTYISYSMATGCYQIAQIYVEPASPIVPSQAIICTGKTVTFTNTGTGGTWSVSNSTVASTSIGAFTLSATGIAPGTTTLTYSFPGGCSRTAVVTVNPSPAAITGIPQVCAHDTTSLSDTSAGGTGTWSSNAPAYAMVSSAGIVTGITGGTATISYTIPNGCFASIVVTVFALPNAGVIVGTDSVCIGNDATQLNNIPGNPGLWYSSNTALLTIDAATGVVNALSAGTAVVTYRTVPDTNGCYNIAVFPISVLSEAPFSITDKINRAKCFGDNDGSILINIINGSGPYIYKWQDSVATSVLTSLAPGTYTVAVTDTKTSCTKSKVFTITQPDSLDLSADVQPDICNQGIGSIKAAASGGTGPYTYAWSNDSTSSDISLLHTGNYGLTITDSNGCRKAYVVPVRDSSGHIHIHDAISPNGDGYNDMWLIDDIQDNPFSHVQIFNKWGDILWHKSAYNNDWDGTGMNGEKLPDGTYFYVINLNNTDPKCEHNLFKGALLIKR
jgi:trimeric autotransporter adhesin